MIRALFHGTCDDTIKDINEQRHLISTELKNALEQLEASRDKNASLLARIRSLEDTVSVLECSIEVLKKEPTTVTVTLDKDTTVEIAPQDPIKQPEPEAKPVSVVLVPPYAAPKSFSNPPRQNDYKKKQR
jgi:formylglycine-generating enzyme required for sulfatase activity